MRCSPKVFSNSWAAFLCVNIQLSFRSIQLQNSKAANEHLSNLIHRVSAT